MRPTCTDCAIKHLAQASILLHESRDGYPDHIFYARGHMAEAEAELALLYPEHSSLVRSERKKLENDPNYNPDYTGLMAKIDEECTVCELMGNPRSTPKPRISKKRQQLRDLAVERAKHERDPLAERGRGKGFKKNSCEAKIERCVLQLKDDPGVDNPYAVCRASIKCTS